MLNLRARHPNLEFPDSKCLPSASESLGASISSKRPPGPLWHCVAGDASSENEGQLFISFICGMARIGTGSLFRTIAYYVVTLCSFISSGTCMSVTGSNFLVLKECGITNDDGLAT
jgi:hypothetical protein